MNLPLAGDTSMFEDRWCPRCAQVCDGGEPDPCIGLIPGVSHACCGHGLTRPYVVIGGLPNQSCTEFEHTTLRDERATLFFVSVAGQRRDDCLRSTVAALGLVAA